MSLSKKREAVLITFNTKNMKRKFNVGLLAFVLGLGLVISQSAFKSASATKRVPVYFKYTGSTFDETAYRDIDNNWQAITNPSEEGCIGDSDICVLSVDSEDLSGSGSMLEQLDDFFNVDLVGPGQVESYVDDPAHREAEQN